MNNSFFLLKNGKPTKPTKTTQKVKFNKITPINHVYTVYTGDTNKLSILNKLIRAGVTTYPILKPENLPKYRKRLRKVIDDFQEYKKSKGGDPIVHVINKSGNFGNPSSFHNLFVRNLRQLTYRKIYPLFKKYVDINPNYDNKKVYLQSLTDRIMLRPIGQTPQKES